MDTKRNITSVYHAKRVNVLVYFLNVAYEPRLIFMSTSLQRLKCSSISQIKLTTLILRACAGEYYSNIVMIQSCANKLLAQDILAQ